MKKIIAILFFILLLHSTSHYTYAITVTPTQPPTPTLSEKAPETASKDVGILKDLKDQIASRVAQLKLVQKKGIIGRVDTISGTQITVLDVNNQQRIVDVDELTKFSSPADKSTFGISDLTKGTTIDILGLYNKQTKHTLARFITVVTVPRFVQGEIAFIDTASFSITVISENGTLTPVDIETVTKTFSYSKDGGLQKAGFSKIESGKQVIVIGFSDKKDPKKIVASRVLLFPDVPKNPRIIIPQQALNPDDTVISSTGSGKKLTPITR